MHAATHLHERRDAIFEISGQTVETSNPGFAEAIARAHAGRLRPRCLCRSEGAEMYVARLAHGYVVKRMPETGNRHAADCPSFAPSVEQTGLAPLLGSAIREDPATGLTMLRLDFPLSRGTGRAAQQRSEPTDDSATARTSRLSLRGLLHYLWDQAELTYWRPGFKGKRSWATVRRHLLRAAEQKTACGDPLLARLYVPEVFTVDQIDAINDRRRTSWALAATQRGRAQQLMLLIAELKGIMPTHRGYKAVIKHVPNVRFSMDDSLYRAMGRSFEQELDVWGASENIHMMMAATFGLNAAGGPAIARLCLMPVTRHWLPVETVIEQQLIERLAREGRTFRKILRYDRGLGERNASVAVTEGPCLPRMLYSERSMKAHAPA